MKTPSTPENLAIHALTMSIATTLEAMNANGGQAVEAAEIGDLDGAVGGLMCVRQKVASLQAQLEAVLELHKQRR